MEFLFPLFYEPELLTGQPLTPLAALLGAGMLLFRGRRSDRVLLGIAAGPLLVAGLVARWQTWATIERTAEPDVLYRAQALADGLTSVMNAPLPFILLLFPLWIGVLLACAWRGRPVLDWRTLIVVAVPLLYASWRVETWYGAATERPVVFLCLLALGALLLLARPERRLTAAIAYAGSTPFVLLYSYMSSKIAPLHCGLVLADSRAARIAHTIDESAFNHGLLLLGALLSFLPVVVARPREGAVAVVVALLGLWLCGHEPVFELVRQAYLPG